MKNALPLLPALVAALLLGALLLWRRQQAGPDAPAAVLQVLRQATPTQVESITVYPLLADEPNGDVRPFQLRGAAQVRALLPGLRQLRPLAVDTSTFQPLLDATVVVHLSRAAARPLRGRDVVLRLATSAQGPVALRAQSRVVYQCTLLSQCVQQARDSVRRARSR